MKFRGKNFVLGMVCCILVTALCVPGVCVSANGEYSYKMIDDTQLELTFSGASDETVTINILALNKTMDELLSVPIANQKDILLYHDQQKTEESGKVVFCVELPDYGRYPLFYKIGDSAVVAAEAVLLDVATEVATLLQTINDSTKTETEKKQAVKDFINNAEINASVSLEKSIFTDVTDDEIVSYLYPSLKEAEGNVSVKSFLTMFNRSVFMVALNNGAVNNLFEHAEYLYLSDSSVKGWLTKPCVTENMQKQITQGIVDESPESNIDFEDKLTEKLILAVVAEPDGVGNVKAVMDDFCDVIDITPSNSLNPYERVEGNSYESLEKLKEAYERESVSNNTVDNPFGVTVPSGGGFSGGGSSGGSFSGGGQASGIGTMQIGSGIVSQTKPEKLEVDIYTDMSDAEWAKDYIIELTEKGIVSGKGDGTFEPNSNVTREEYVKLIVMAFAPDADKTDVNFVDVSKDAWYYPYVCMAYNSGLIKGYEDGKFGIGEKISREDMAVIANRAAAIKATDGTMYLSDFDNVSDYAKEAVKVLYNGGIISGYEGRFYPKNPATRAEAAKIICLLLAAV